MGCIIVSAGAPVKYLNPNLPAYLPTAFADFPKSRFVSPDYLSGQATRRSGRWQVAGRRPPGRRSTAISVDRHQPRSYR
jgi:hypothetical protein